MGTRNNAIINPQILKWARERLELSLEEAAEYLKIGQDALKLWEESGGYPTIIQAKKIAKKLKIPYVYFFLPDPPDIKLPKNENYRTFYNEPVKKYDVELKSFLFDIVQRREVMLDLCHQMEIEVKPFNCFFDIKTSDAAAIARAVRELLQLPDRFEQKDRSLFNYFRSVLENAGVLVFQAVNIPPGVMRGLSFFEEVFPVIAVNRADTVHARIFTLMHELAHLVTRTAGICDDSGMTELSQYREELKCNHIAAEILVPREQLKSESAYQKLLDRWNDADIRQIANAFSVSREVILGRMLLFKDISLSFYRDKMNQYKTEYTQSTRIKNETGGFIQPATDKESQFGKVYIETVLTAYNQEIISPRDAVQYFDGLRLKHFEKLERWCFS
jgi:Zn-dependent peptidase ImmA (M78 family)/transcriptional regulator with XRE-family HTH domain